MSLWVGQTRLELSLLSSIRESAVVLLCLSHLLTCIVQRYVAMRSSTAPFGSKAFVHCLPLLLSSLYLSSSVQPSCLCHSSTSQLCSPVCNHLVICPYLLSGLPSARRLLQHLNPAAPLLLFCWIFVPAVVITSMTVISA